MRLKWTRDDLGAYYADGRTATYVITRELGRWSVTRLNTSRGYYVGSARTMHAAEVLASNDDVFREGV